MDLRNKLNFANIHYNQEKFIHLIDNIYEQEDENKHTLLMRACINGYMPVVIKLIEKGAKIDTKSSYDGKTALQFAVEIAGNLAIVDYLIDHGADLNSQDKNGTTVLIEAISKETSDIAMRLIDRGADVNLKDISNDETPIMTACCYGLNNLIDKLIEKKANVDAKFNGGKTALMFAIDEGRSTSCIIQLLDAGANPYIQDNDGRSAVDLINKRNLPEALSHLKFLIRNKILEAINESQIITSTCFDLNLIDIIVDFLL